MTGQELMKLLSFVDAKIFPLSFARFPSDVLSESHSYKAIYISPKIFRTKSEKDSETKLNFRKYSVILHFQTFKKNFKEKKILSIYDQVIIIF